ncbi:hypothetical protein [Alkalihalobacterium alkalinitrilicum]|uniref:hypothetical protein n=1 Tax=Alkalihalobacterium alkalinitrilicum TaxID=427920 RepID=UPI000994D9A8|nr:hypothetical protein [Alkalihalobacterium alkalinitrilicum]
MSNKKWWLFAGILYLALVIGGYTLITGANPLESGNIHSDHTDHGEESYGIVEDPIEDEDNFEQKLHNN